MVFFHESDWSVKTGFGLSTAAALPVGVVKLGSGNSGHEENNDAVVATNT